MLTKLGVLSVKEGAEGGGGSIRVWVYADNVSDGVGVDWGLSAEGAAFVIGLRDDYAALGVLFVPRLGWCSEREGGEGGEGEEEGEEAGHSGCYWPRFCSFS